jgi:hypothetical protein
VGLQLDGDAHQTIPIIFELRKNLLVKEVVLKQFAE